MTLAFRGQKAQNGKEQSDKRVPSCLPLARLLFSHHFFHVPLAMNPYSKPTPWHTVHIYIYHKDREGFTLICLLGCNSFSFCNSSHFGSGRWLVEEMEETPTTDLAWSWMAGRSRDFQGFSCMTFISLHYHIYLCLSGRRFFRGFLQPSVGPVVRWWFQLKLAELQHAGNSTPFWLESWSDLALWGLKVAMEKSLFVAPRQIRQISVLAGQGDFPWDYYMNILYTSIHFTVYIYIHMFPDCRWGGLLRACMCGNNGNSSML